MAHVEDRVCAYRVKSGTCCMKVAAGSWPRMTHLCRVAVLGVGVPLTAVAQCSRHVLITHVTHLQYNSDGWQYKSGGAVQM